MNDQPEFFDDDPFPPHQRHSETSRDAAREIEPRAGILRRVVLDWLRGRGDHGGTDEEGIAATGMSPSTYRPRRVELVNHGLVEDSERTRRTVSGRKAVVWVARIGDCDGRAEVLLGEASRPALAADAAEGHGA